MRLGKEQSAGFVEDSDDAAVHTEVFIPDSERAPATADPELTAADG